MDNEKQVYVTKKQIRDGLVRALEQFDPSLDEAGKPAFGGVEPEIFTIGDNVFELLIGNLTFTVGVSRKRG